MEDRYMFRGRDPVTGVVHEVELTREQAHQLSGSLTPRAVAYFPHNEQVLIGDSGQIVVRESAVPLELPDAA